MLQKESHPTSTRDAGSIVWARKCPYGKSRPGRRDSLRSGCAREATCAKSVPVSESYGEASLL